MADSLVPAELTERVEQTVKSATRAATLAQAQEKLYLYFKAQPLVWGKAMFPHHFRDESPQFHKEILVAALTSKRLAIAAPRESAKSTLLVFLYPIHGLYFNKFRFVVLVSNTFKKAAMHLESIKKELLDNEELRKYFPKVEVTKDAEGDSEFRLRGFRSKFICKGVDQIGSIRGVKFGAYRPDLILGDDIEDDELVKNPERRRSLQSEFDEALMPAGEKGVCQYINIGTILHDDSQMAKLVSPDHYQDWKKLIYRGHIQPDTPQEHSLWPQKWSLDYLKELRRDKPTVYAKEIQNDPVAGTNVRFKREDFCMWKHIDSDYVLHDREGVPMGKNTLRMCKAAVACDLAWSEMREADASVIMSGLLTPDSDILIESYINKKGMRPDEVAEYLFVLVDRLEKLTGSPVPVGFEKAMLENVTKFLLRREMKARNRFIQTKELVWDADKNKRIEIRLSARYEQHVIYHKSAMGELEYQLERFPYGTHDDLIDAEQGLVQLLQFPKDTLKLQQQDSEFDWYRKQAQKLRDSPLPKTKTGAKYRRAHMTIPAKESWR